MSGGRKPASGLSDEDAALWRDIGRSVKPLAPDRQGETAEADPVGQPENKARQPAGKKPPRPAALPAARIRAIAHPPYVPPVSRAGAAVRRPGGIDERTAEMIVRGSLPIGGRLDLHGMTEANAHAALSGFIERSARAGAKVVLVITGKGERSGGALRLAAPRWLSERPLAEFILGVRQADMRHGAQGALYVRLRASGGRKP
jgi:DNA-nicking Smr family endonuclease